MDARRCVPFGWTFVFGHCRYYIHLYSPNDGSVNEKIYIGRKINNKNTEAELNNMQTPRLLCGGE